MFIISSGDAHLQNPYFEALIYFLYTFEDANHSLKEYVEKTDGKEG